MDFSEVKSLTDMLQMLPNHTSSFLHAGSKFRGTQQSDRQVYKVEVDIKHVDMAESFLCGYLRIEGENHPQQSTRSYPNLCYNLQA